MSEPGALRELAGLFVRLGVTGFGGPAAHVAMMHREVVHRRAWMSEQTFLDLLGATNLIPGPNSTEMAMHIGVARARWKGLIVAGACFIAPALLIVLGLAWAYVRYGSTPAATGLLYGVEPVVVAIVVVALGALARTAVKRSGLLVGVGVAAGALYLAGLNELIVLAGGAVAVWAVRSAAARPHGAMALLAPPLLLPLLPATAAVSIAATPSLLSIFGLFLKFGAVVYGSGYVLFAFLRGDLVDRLGWLTEGQLIDALALGQLTPGPVFTAATFIGYLLHGVSGALLATLAIFLPSFFFVALLQPLVRAVRRRGWAGALLDGLNVAALGLMAGVTMQIARRALVDVPAILIGVVALGLLALTKTHHVLVLAGGAAIGLLLRA